ncbi:MAG TPA: class I SAM-dependent methyltransferase [Acidimicrobiales bacterium]|nr:class I SAM-dependent methyltransferase [Acidimicrobiales bacterium]
MVDSSAPPPATDEELALFALKVWQFKQGQMVALMLHLGDELALFEAMADKGPMTSDGLADATGLSERWVREWLLGMAAAEVIDSGDGQTFSLSTAGAEVLTHHDRSLWYAGGALSRPHPDRVVDGITNAFHTGIGLVYDELGPNGAHQIERMSAPWTREALVPVVLELVDGLVDRLQAGAHVIDVGCGSAGALCELAQAFPSSTFVGYDPSTHAIERGNDRVRGLGLDNVVLFEAGAEAIDPAATIDLALTFDCLHDMPYPSEALTAIHDALADDGVLLVKEIRSAETFEENRKNPVLAMMYGFSLTTCMSSSASEPDGAALGTLGLPPSRLEALVTASGFEGGFEVHDIGDPTNLYYVVRP